MRAWTLNARVIRPRAAPATARAVPPSRLLHRSSSLSPRFRSDCGSGSRVLLQHLKSRAARCQPAGGADAPRHAVADGVISAIKLCAAAVSLLLRPSADGVEERSLVPRSRSRTRIGRNATMSHDFSCVQPAFIDS
ncbi:hypothetical protein EVAR_4553_1 [Eumeta japonica]|uniref:Uncharacterized protein n=1 Tax=Eumeta variegata TaxID=151549 RepID=A0A4C1SWU4_EUMVA|nr:hypothetical protein EVAR_4553_1 [Eumeta japonica]